MNFKLPFVPERPQKQRESGITMVMDKGLSLKESENMIEASSEYIDFVKFGFGTSMLCNQLHDKIKAYKDADIRPYFGGTLFEAFVIRNMFKEYLRYLDVCEITTVEVSDGSMYIPHEKKCEYIRELSKDFYVISEVGSKDASVNFSAEQWKEMMQKELDAGAKKVIAEARESGNVGIYKSTGSADEDLIGYILNHISPEKIIWEAPLKPQVVWFIKKIGPNVNLGNIAPNEVISTETLRLGLRGDTFLDFLPEEFVK
ncbi:MAG: phosphosulfolactate synthase [Bacteroidetes bacterium RIFOXYA12_FULL_35_11]|nr:MAG: phosphosulfolactate synthase [Bacteroidetes bacterium GWF2_35_48]OFY74551.1 MAG: phosphosulfolactate synthase [Bacteroidetes bacterium RIFOXYA12_FULL_35_11]OFY95186.1 MAG: phosphosulfolactate synthase [Bacteroidetes bacterium RIFOXYB2_FULL_35_7]HBX52864.1 phosphosulfolactate synthase [Bacteroidales bacterium]